MTHLIGLLLDFYNVLLQFLAILDPRFGLEELFSLRIQYQKTGVGWESTKVHFNFAVTVHDCRPLDLVRVRVERKAQDMGETSFILQVTARVTSAADTDFISRACEALGRRAVRKTVAYVSDRTSFYGNILCLANFRASAKHALATMPSPDLSSDNTILGP